VTCGFAVAPVRFWTLTGRARARCCAGVPVRAHGEDRFGCDRGADVFEPAGVSAHRARGVGARYERLDISSSNFPLYDRNSNIGGFSATEAPEIVVGLVATPPDYPARVASRFTVELAGRLAERGDADVRFAHVWRVRAMRGYYEGLSPPLPAGTPAARCKGLRF
jgi:hypothetical protein